MKTSERGLLKTAVLKWIALLALVLTIAVPAEIKTVQASPNTYRVSVAKGYLALRSQAAYDDRNEIGELYSGDIVEVSDYSGAYWWVYSSKYGCSGYVNKDYLVFAGESAAPAASSGSTWTVSVKSGYLALRTAKAYDSRNEIGELYTGDTFQVTDSSDGTYWYGYAPKLGKSGYVNKNYLYGGSTPASGGDNWTVSVAKGYLALRTAKAYDSRNEIGELYSGDTFQVTDYSDSSYWYGYSPKLGKSGYVNKDYLVGGSAPKSSGSTSYTVSVSKGYLALRTQPSYDERNEIGELYTGDTVTVESANQTSSAYWFVYSPKLGKSGYVNKDYLTGASSPAPAQSGGRGPSYTVSVSKGYLALRTGAAYDERNEIGELYSGDTVQFINSGTGGYWYVYSPKLGKEGYVNKDYLY